MRDALQLRQSLVPYIYSATREAFETGVSLIRPMYYYNQKVDKAYDVPEQYYFGSKMMIRPVVEKGDASTMAQISIWLPQVYFRFFFIFRIIAGADNYTLYLLKP